MPELFTQRLRISDLLPGDLDDVHALNSLPETDEFNTLGIPENLETTRALIENRLGRHLEVPRLCYVMCIFLLETDQFVGMMGINLSEPFKQRGEIWYKLHKDYWGQGYASEAVQRILQFAFSELNLHRVEAGCATENIASIKVLEKAGFIREGRCRKILPIRGQWVDNYLYAILEEDFSSAKERDHEQ